MGRKSNFVYLFFNYLPNFLKLNKFSTKMDNFIPLCKNHKKSNFVNPQPKREHSFIYFLFNFSVGKSFFVILKIEMQNKNQFASTTTSAA